MFKPFRTAAVLGAGVMGTQIAAHLANAGLIVYLLDLPAAGDRKNALVEAAFKKGLKQKPPIFFTEKTSRRVILGNFEEDWHRLASVDWVVEAVIEKLDVKQQLMARLDGFIREDAVVSTNTSGLPIHAIAEGRSKSFQQRFLGTHFFNPPRYLKLLELIPTSTTDPEIVKRLEWFGRLHLGKGVVIAKDTPNFIGNRIGLFVSLLGIRALTDQGYTIEEIDILTGTLVGRPKSATLRTADLVGLDTLTYVAENLYPMIPDDESRDVFLVPQTLRQMVEASYLGAKTGEGFYKKVGGKILSLDIQTFNYRKARPIDLGGLDAIAKIKSLPERLQALYKDTGRAGTFFRQTTLKILSYSAHRIPEIADSPSEIDRAMRWGFGWRLGPFEMWDVLGFETVIKDMQASGIAVPSWVEQMQWAGAHSFYQEIGREEEDLTQSPHPLHFVYQPQRGYGPIETPRDEFTLAPFKVDPTRTLWQNSEAALLDIGDGVVLFEFRSKGNTLSRVVVDGFSEALDLIEEGDYCGLVIGNDGEHFSAGANLADMVKFSHQDRVNVFADCEHGAIAKLLDRFQALMLRLHYFPQPIVAAIRGRVLGGGCELVMACPHVVAAAETYIGLVELSVGLVPGAGGIMTMATWAAEHAATDDPSDIQPFLKRAFETIGTAKVSGSAYEAQEWGYLPPTAEIVMNSDRRLYVAKEEVLRLDHEGYAPPPKRNAIKVLGKPARALFETAAYLMQKGGYISEYDRFLANRLAYVITGGDLSAPSMVSDDYLLGLEREMFLPLFGQKKTQERIMHTLRTKKPLRN
ncbi:putative 3-hydroxyacyl-CoA dehydrogenase [Acaryochloris thomasi RCC1774]|uniref:Putative 3-hydroxyacyl-CoA dehydrogenase n=1 Tax=Acaryochloris thomasi RCC1774 TaxID=1764569 RepID=A0A2W1JSN4_9CYAN|nr:3-hydroxyacyl-CoA dehydrogenase/enoyl-CoA hydratase family protein [Acaryochloris thomasi]PZD72011.1 putative 3-hydroxyacyl-CoA dehydrogenase [Acaryochloris thomasi RCC1774]